MPNYELKPLPADLTEDEYFYLLTLEFRSQQFHYQMSENNRRDSKRMALDRLGITNKSLRRKLLYDKESDYCILCWQQKECDKCPADDRPSGDGFCRYSQVNLYSSTEHLLHEWGIENLKIIDAKATRLRAVIRNRRK